MFLSDQLQEELRRIGKISNNEVLKKEGDLFVAVNVLNQQRRIVTLDGELIERIHRFSGSSSHNKRVLKG